MFGGILQRFLGHPVHHFLHLARDPRRLAADPHLHLRAVPLSETRPQLPQGRLVLDGYEGGLPSARYLGLMADAAEKAGAPDDYVREMRARPCRTIGD